MSVGRIQYIFVCVPQGDGYEVATDHDVVYCKLPGSDAGAAWGVMKQVPSYALDASAGTQFELSLQPFEPAVAAQYFAYGLISTMTVWGLAYAAGRLIHMIQKA